jgi:hypothetical protein
MRRVFFLALTAAIALLVCAAPAFADYGFRENGFDVSITNKDGTPDIQAGSHPYKYTTKIALKEIPADEEGHPPYTEGGNTKDVVAELPAGFVGDAGSVPSCPISVFSHYNRAGVLGDSVACPDDTQVGTTILHLSFENYQEPVYNLTPVKGAPAEFGFIAITSPVVLIPHVRTGEDYGVTVDFSSLPEAYSLINGSLTLWGVPADPVHNSERGHCLAGLVIQVENEGECPVTVRPLPFLTLPTSCGKPLRRQAPLRLH